MSHRPRILPFITGLALILLASTAHAQVRIVAHTDVPVFVGGGLDIETAGRLRVASSLGRLPGGYVGLANAVLVPVFADDGYDPRVGELVRATIKSSTVWRTTLGWRPLKKAGFVLGAGYTLAGLGGDATAAELLGEPSGTPVPTQAGRDAEFRARATVQVLHAEVGWTWDLPKGLWLRTGVGMGMTVKATTEVKANFDVERPELRKAVEAFELSTEQFLHETLTSYVHPPHISIALGFWI